jgi:Heparinase II/III-like protein/Heparinase II/III N-terminus
LNLLGKLRAYLQLDARSIFDVLVYRIGLKSGLHPVLHLTPAAQPLGVFFGPFNGRPSALAATQVWQDRPWAFGRASGALSNNPPAWHTSALTGQHVRGAADNWNKVASFSEEIGDIKSVWEASRFDWVVAFAQSAAQGNSAALEKLNVWLSDWTANNPAYRGPNWMCGQEASFRVVHLAIASSILGQLNAVPDALTKLVLNHLRRIKPTIAYARGQDNNHATSEAMALFVGGMWLYNCSDADSVQVEAQSYIRAGRKLLEERVQKLIFDDGGFAQYSIVYHRLMLDSLSVTEFFRQYWNAEQFSVQFYQKAIAATAWLAEFTNPDTGDAPNLGSNDGAWLLPIGSGRYRDFRPSCALASTLFDTETYFPDAPTASSLLGWLGLQANPPHQKSLAPIAIYPDSGIAVLTQEKTRVYIRLPGYKFRPHQSDALHIDVWHDGKCLLQDGGTFSYAASDWKYFPSVAAHNSIEFDGRDQMPRAGRFLFGKWLQRDAFVTTENSVMASYTDYRGVSHKRTVTLHGENRISVADEISGPFKNAILRWRPGVPIMQTTANQFENDSLSITVMADANIQRCELMPHKSSRFYLHCEDIMAVEAQVRSACTIVTEIEVKS